MSLASEEDIEMGKGYLSGDSFRYLRLLLVSLLLATMAALAGLNSSNPTSVDTSAPPALADHTGGTTGGG
jgi:hypothetical protein